MKRDKVMTFLRQSNQIEGVFSKKAHDQARMAWDYLIGQDVLTYENVCETHKLLMQGLLEPEHIGHWRKIPVMIAGRIPPNPGSLNRMMYMWMYHANIPTNSEEQIRREHIQFERIHPFVDGNGRMGRILMNWQRLKFGFDVLVIWSRQPFRSRYYSWFSEVIPEMEVIANDSR